MAEEFSKSNEALRDSMDEEVQKVSVRFEDQMKELMEQHHAEVIAFFLVQ
jgi:hypothetical protein